MSTAQLIVIDDRDSCQELHTLLSKLPPRDRIHFLTRACRMVPQGRGRLPVPCVTHMQTTLEEAYRSDQADFRLTREVFCDILSLVRDFDLDPVAATLELTEWVKRPSYRQHQIARHCVPSAPLPASRPAGSSRRGGSGT